MTRTLTASLVTLGSPDRVSGGSLYQRCLGERAPAHGFDLRFVALPERPLPLASQGAAGWLLAGPDDADVVVIDSIAAAALAPVRSRLPRPVVALLHQPPGGMDAPRLQRAAQAALDRSVYAAADLVVATSRFLAREVSRELGVPVAVVPPGREAPPALAATPPRASTGPFALLCVANWLPRKGVLELLGAVGRLPPGTAVLHLVGRDDADRSYARRVRQRLDRPDLAGRVVVHGVVPPERLGAFYAKADAFVLPSFVEPYGMVYGEAMAAGLPVVGWRAGNLPHLVDHEVEGLLVEPGDVPALADALHRVVVDTDLRAGLAAAARARAAELPTWDESAARFFGLLRQVIADGPRP